MLEKETIVSGMKLRDSYNDLQIIFCAENNIDQNTLIDSGEWYQKFNVWRDEKMKAR